MTTFAIQLNYGFFADAHGNLSKHINFPLAPDAKPSQSSLFTPLTTSAAAGKALAAAIAAKAAYQAEGKPNAASMYDGAKIIHLDPICYLSVSTDKTKPGFKALRVIYQGSPICNDKATVAEALAAAKQMKVEPTLQWNSDVSGSPACFTQIG